MFRSSIVQDECLITPTLRADALGVLFPIPQKRIFEGSHGKLRKLGLCFQFAATMRKVAQQLRTAMRDLQLWWYRL